MSLSASANLPFVILICGFQAGGLSSNSSSSRLDKRESGIIPEIIKEGRLGSEVLQPQPQPYQQRAKRREQYYYGHPQSPFFDRYYENSAPASISSEHRREGSWGGKMMKRFRDKTTSLLDAASSVSFAHENYGDGEEDLEPAGAFWNIFSTGGGGYGGRGYGHGGGGYGKGVNKSAVGLLGFLSLLSLIQSGLTTTTAAPAAGGGRRGRSDVEQLSPEKEKESQKIADIVLPLLSSITYFVQDVRVPERKLKCILNEVCTANHKLVTEFGEHGKDVGSMMSNVFESMVKKMQMKSPNMDNELLMKMKYAARAGRNRKDCEKQYPPTCED